jgi:uncharacterized protein (TIGR02646 family)
MKNIKKGEEPTELKEYKATAFQPTYNGLGNKERNAIRVALIKEQKSICAFCMGRIENRYTLGIKHKSEGEDDGYNIKIAHWMPQNPIVGLENNLTLDYNNMLGVCKGGGRKEAYQHCDKKQGNKSLKINPTKDDCETLFCYGIDGEIFVAVDDDEIEKGINKTLNLNVEKLLTKRREVIDEAIR